MVLQPNFGSCQKLGGLFFSLFQSIPEICLAKVIARHVLNKGIVHILHVGDCNWAIFHRSWVRNAERIDFIPASYKIRGRWQGQAPGRRLLAVLLLRSCRRSTSRHAHEEPVQIAFFYSLGIFFHSFDVWPIIPYIRSIAHRVSVLTKKPSRTFSTCTEKVEFLLVFCLHDEDCWHLKVKIEIFIWNNT